jgi:hypothetical protein
MLEDLREALAAFEKEFTNLSAVSKVEQLQPVIDANNRLQELLT